MRVRDGQAADAVAGLHHASEGIGVERLAGVLARQAIDANNLIAARHWMDRVPGADDGSHPHTRVTSGVLAAKVALAEGSLIEAEANAREALEYGIVGANVGIISTEVAPFGGVKESGIGREGIRFAIEDMTEIRLMVVRTKR